MQGHEGARKVRSRLYARPGAEIDADFCPNEDERADDDDSTAERDDADVRPTHVPEQRACSGSASHGAVGVRSAHALGSLKHEGHLREGNRSVEHANAGPDVGAARDLRDARDDERVEAPGEEAVERGEGEDGRGRVRAHPERKRENAAEESARDDQGVVSEPVGEVGREQPPGYARGVEHGEDVEGGRGGEAVRRGVVDDVEVGYEEAFYRGVSTYASV